MLRLLKTEFRIPDSRLVDLSFRDESTVYAKLKRVHHQQINKNAAI